jgi:hypothetical protein
LPVAFDKKVLRQPDDRPAAVFFTLVII